MLFNWGIGVGLIHAVKRALASAISALFTYDMTDGTLEAGQTFGRASTAYHQQPDGTLVAVASGEARFSGMRRVSQGVYSALDAVGAALPGPFGLLVEPAATNYVNNSNLLTDWFLSNLASATTGTAASPVSGNFLKVIPAAAGGTRKGLYEPNGSRFPSNVPCVVSCVAKADGYSFFAIEVQDGALTDDRRSIVVFNLTTGEFAGSYGVAPTEYGSKELQPGLWFCWAAIPELTTAVRNVMILPLDQVRDPNVAYLSDGTSGVSFGCFMITAGVKPSSFILTTTAAATRAVDTLAIADVPADNETRITYSDGSTADLDDWDGTVPTPTAPVKISKIDVYATGARPA